MSVVEIITTVGVTVGALGGFEFIKWLFSRRNGLRQEEAQADSSEFAVLRDTNIFLQEQLRLKEERFAEQTSRVRKLTTENLELVRKVAMLEAERALKLCEKRNCLSREPQSGY